jgi:hypothetical protein
LKENPAEMIEAFEPIVSDELAAKLSRLALLIEFQVRGGPDRSPAVPRMMDCPICGTEHRNGGPCRAASLRGIDAANTRSENDEASPVSDPSRAPIGDRIREGFRTLTLSDDDPGSDYLPPDLLPKPWNPRRGKRLNSK